jgi:hypothetical protein
MRYTVTFQIDIEARDDKHAVSKAQMIADRQNDKHPAQRWIVSDVSTRPWASFSFKKVDISSLIRK